MINFVSTSVAAFFQQHCSFFSEISLHYYLGRALSAPRGPGSLVNVRLARLGGHNGLDQLINWTSCLVELPPRSKCCERKPLCHHWSWSWPHLCSWSLWLIAGLLHHCWLVAQSQLPIRVFIPARLACFVRHVPETLQWAHACKMVKTECLILTYSFRQKQIWSL